MGSPSAGGAGAKAGGSLVGIRLKPGASRERIVSVEDDAATLAVTAAPVDGKANESMIRLLSKALDVSKSSISIRKGATSRNKLVEVAGMTKEEVLRKLKSEMER
jgi:uncharacterized protein (TIGR00251 family)